MNLSKEPAVVQLKDLHYLFVEKIGPFHETAMGAWNDVHRILKGDSIKEKKIGALSLFKMKPQMVYRAGVIYESKPTFIPDQFQYIKFPGGKYSKFVLTGPYSNLGPAWGEVMSIIQEKQLKLRDDYFVENYANDPAIIPEEKLISELMVPTE